MVGTCIFIFVGVINTIYAKETIDFNHIQYVHGDLCNHLGIDSNTYLESIRKCLHKSSMCMPTT